MRYVHCGDGVFKQLDERLYYDVEHYVLLTGEQDGKR